MSENNDDVLTIPLDEEKLVEILDKFSTDVFETMKFLEAYAISVGKSINRVGVFGKLLDKWGVKDMDRVT